MKAIRISAAAILFCLAGPALADNGKTPPGNPCGKGNGNPCGGNNGNAGQQGNGGNGNGHGNGGGQGGGGFVLARPAVTDRHVYITQIGSENRATVRQTAPNAYARITQDGRANIARVTQTGVAIAYADLTQLGTANDALVTQGGVAAGTMLDARQDGVRNALTVSQTAETGELGAKILQAGNDNVMALTQSGGDNMAKLTQDGNGNTMTATQERQGNRLVWTQDGNNLSNLAITQSGGQTLWITQTK